MFIECPPYTCQVLNVHRLIAYRDYSYPTCQMRKLRLRTSGLPMALKCQASAPGCRAFSITDPDGLLLGLAHPNAFPWDLHRRGAWAPSLVSSSNLANPGVGLQPLRSNLGDNGRVCGGRRGRGCPPARCPLSSRLLPSCAPGGWEAPLAGFLLPFLC